MGVTPLVSIISPCHNGEEYVGRMLDSILAQTYTHIEMICVDNGSEDNTAEIIESYSPKFEEKNMSLKLMRQDDQGPGGALNNALKYVNGDYLCWIDCDDFLTEDSVEIKLNILENSDEYGICSSDYYYVNEDNLSKILRRDIEKSGHLNYQKNQFMLCLTRVGSGAPLRHMIRMRYFDKINPKREIYNCRYGQNKQMLLPIYYHYPRYYIDKPLGYYVIRSNSCSHIIRTNEENKLLYNEFI
ncbi:MAG: glycosyltransferase, partial [Oscillospiraceae bacterium]|nr:glycosyltransferase [Oscillospiraceae bacterium]